MPWPFCFDKFVICRLAKGIESVFAITDIDPLGCESEDRHCRLLHVHDEGGACERIVVRVSLTSVSG